MKMIHCLVASALLVLFSIAATAQSSLLWEITGNDLSRPSYLYGTFHSQDARAHEFGDSVLVKLLKCEAFVGEITGMEDHMNGKEALRLAQMQGTTLKQLLKKKDYERVKDFARDRIGFLAFMVNKLKPMFTMTLLSQLNLHPDMDYTVDNYLEKLAESRGLNIISLESVEEQLGALDAIPLEEQADMLVDYVKNHGKADFESAQMIEMYRNQDLDALYGLYGQSGYKNKKQNGFDRELIFKRNHTMAQRVDSLLNIQSCFVGVGALHLPGEYGLIELLRKRGFTVEPVFSTYTPGSRLEIEPEEEPWVEISLEPSSIAGSFPSEPEIERDSAGVVGYLWFEEGITLSVELEALPAHALEKENMKGIYLDATSTARKVKLDSESNTEVEAFEKGSVNGIVCVDTQVNLPDENRCFYRTLIAGDYKITMMVLGAGDAVESERAVRFLDSVKLLDADATED